MPKSRREKPCWFLPAPSSSLASGPRPPAARQKTFRGCYETRRPTICATGELPGSELYFVKLQSIFTVGYPPCASCSCGELLKVDNEHVPDLIQIGQNRTSEASACAPKPRARVFWIQGITLIWMLVEFGVAAYAAISSRSPAMFAFGSDSLVELLSAVLVLLQWTPRFSVSEAKATRVSAILLFALALAVMGIAAASLLFRHEPATSMSGIAITMAALIAMPVLATLKKREAKRSGNRALAADAVQSATCAYLAAIALAGLVLNMLFHIAWFDSVAALVCVPILIKEGRSAWQGQHCGCC